MKKLVFLLSIIGLCLCACSNGKRKLISSYQCYSYFCGAWETECELYKNGSIVKWKGHINEWRTLNFVSNYAWWFEYSGSYYVMEIGTK